MTALADRDFSRILIIKPSAVGDVVHTLPLLVKLRRRYPAAQIDWFITPENAELVRAHPALSNIVLFPRRQYARFGTSPTATLGVVRLLAELRRAHYDLVVDVHGQARSAVFALATGAKCRVGYERAREWAWLAYSHRVPVPTMDCHAVDRYLGLSDVLNLDRDPPDFTICLPPAVDERANELLAGEGLIGQRYSVISPSTTWETKFWSPEHFGEVARHLSARGLRVLVVGAPSERERCRMVAEQCPGAIDLAGRTSLGVLAAVMRQAAICVTNDSGTMHLAAALGRPFVSVFGPTNPVRTGPYQRPDAVVRLDLECSPCLLRKLRHCRHEHRCLRDLGSSLVIERIELVLATRAAA
ncbi:MAG: lipopolysaccharide heptosyltransferase II [Pirellulales bacterium]|nr:lipopolysaccharide heptosyltransferase II [Pirellulales bacterium]